MRAPRVCSRDLACRKKGFGVHGLRFRVAGLYADFSVYSGRKPLERFGPELSAVGLGL